MNRAYSVFEIKAADDAEHIIEGIASTPSPDRVGDVVEPKGAAFNLPLPLLWQHDSRSPIGRVLSATVTKSGIAIKAKIETGVLPEIDRAWALIKSGLVRGLSIGFRALEMEPLNPKEPWGGQRFLKWEWLELSAVTIPANQDASISAIKSLCASGSSAADARTSHTSLPAAVGVTERKGAPMALPISDQVTKAQDELRAASLRLTELNDKEAADGDLSNEEAVEVKGLTSKVSSLADKVERLKAIERSQAVQARPVIVKASDDDVREIGKSGRVTVGDGPEAKLPPGIEFARAVMCRMAALKSGVSALDFAKHYYRDFPRIQAFLKEAVPAASTQDSSWAGPLVYAQNLVSEFVDWLRPQTIIGRIQGMTTVPFNVRIGGQTSGGAGYWVGEGRAKPLTMWGANPRTLTWAKVANIAVITDELARFSNPAAETYVRNELGRSCLERLDTDFVDPAKAAVANVSPASITNGLTNLNATGTALSNIDADVGTIMARFAQNFITPTHWVMPNTVALQLSLARTSLGARAFPDINMNGGTFMGLPVVTSQYCILGTPSNNLVILLSAPDIFISDDGGFSVDVSREASLEMDDAPTQTAGSLGSPTGASGSVVVSMFQTNSMAVRCERMINWARRRDAGVQWMDDVQWGGAIPS